MFMDDDGEKERWQKDGNELKHDLTLESRDICRKGLNNGRNNNGDD